MAAITLPDSLLAIEEDAFIDCRALKSISVSQAHADRLLGLLAKSGFDMSGVSVRHAGDEPDVESSTLIPGEMTSIDTGLIGYMAKKLPSGLKYNKKTGCIEGAAKKTGTYPFSLTVTTKAGSKVTQNFELVVAEEKPLGGVQLWENGPYWAECNVGATKPEEYGYYFWWGDTVGYACEGGTWDDFCYLNVTWVSSTGTRMGKCPFRESLCPTYDKSVSLLQSAGYIGSAGNLVASHDAATAHLGAPWRMPTSEEMQALVDNCTATWMMRNGVYGRLVTGKGVYSSKSIFLPAAGDGSAGEDGNESLLNEPGLYSLYWSSSPGSDYFPDHYHSPDDSRCAWNLGFHSDGFYRTAKFRFYGCPVRPVRGFAK